jgi:hypothetical protein
MFKLLTRLKVPLGSAHIKTFRRTSKTKAWLLSILTLVITFKMFDKNWREDTAVSVQDRITETACVRETVMFLSFSVRE